MLSRRIIPCLDVNAGRVVKGINFVNLRDAGDPVEQARVYDAQGADELCFLDITASYENRKTILDVVARTAEQVFMPLTVGGGVRKVEDVRRLLNAGADKVSINTAAVQNPQWATPQALDGSRPIETMSQWQDRNAKKKAENPNLGTLHKPLTVQVNGKLNPRWVETLQGVCMGWTSPSCPASVIRNWPKFMSGWSNVTIEPTNSGCSGMESCQPPPQGHLPF